MTERYTDDQIETLCAELAWNQWENAAAVIEQLQGDLKTVLDREAETHRRHDAKFAALEADNAALRADVERLREALKPFCFFDEEGGDVQHAWEIRYKDRFQDWIDFKDIESARAALGAS